MITGLQGETLDEAAESLATYLRNVTTVEAELYGNDQIDTIIVEL